MAEYQLSLDVIARTLQLEQGLNKSVRLINSAATKMQSGMKQFDAGRIGKEIGNGMMSGLRTAFGAALIFQVISGALDSASKLATGEYKKTGMTAGTFFLEGFTQQLQSVPIAGPIGTMIGAIFGAYDFERLQEERSRQRSYIEEEMRLQEASARSTQSIREAAAAMAEEERRKEEEASAKRLAIAKQIGQSLTAAGNSFTLAIQPLETQEEILKLRAKGGSEREILIQQQLLELRQDYWQWESKIESARQSGNKKLEERLTKHRDIVRAQKEINQQLQLEAFDREQAAAAAEKAAEAAEAAAKREAEFREKAKQAKEEIEEARSKAQQSVEGATGTFRTAGGSFVTAVRAQMDESKLLREISKESRDYLAQIVSNTATAFMGFV